MDPLAITISVVKALFGAILGFFIGAIVLVTDSGVMGMIVGAILLGYLLFAISVVEIGGALVLGFIIFAIGSYFELVSKLANRFPVADALGQALWVDSFFSLLIIFMVGLILAKLLWGKATEDSGIPESVNWGCGLIIGLIFVGILFWGASKGSADASIASWVWGGGIIGFLLSFMPGHPLM